MTDLQSLLTASASLHSHLCPRQVLGVRLALAGGRALGLDLPRKDKRLLVIAEMDGCFTDGVMVAAGVSVGRRTLRVEDYGKVAATFVDTETGAAFRIAPQPDIRQKARLYAPEERKHYFAMLTGYERMPDEALLTVRPVELTTPLKDILSRPGLRACCDLCGEEIVNEREVHRHGQVLCRACAGPVYYRYQEGLCQS